MNTLKYGYLDESGILEIAAGEGRYFVIVVILVGNPSELKHIMRQARRKFHGTHRMHHIFKASKEDQGFVNCVLRELAKTNVEIFVGAWDKRQKGSVPDKNHLYASLVAQTVAACMIDAPRLHLVAHRRFTNPHIRDYLQWVVSEYIAVGTFLSLEQCSERERKELELADAVAWAVYQKYNNNDDQGYAVIKSHIKKENRLTA